MLQGPKSLVHIRVRTSCNRSGTHSRDLLGIKKFALTARRAPDDLRAALTRINNASLVRTSLIKSLEPDNRLLALAFE
jgi:hypothetical protein